MYGMILRTICFYLTIRTIDNVWSFSPISRQTICLPDGHRSRVPTEVEVGQLVRSKEGSASSGRAEADARDRLRGQDLPALAVHSAVGSQAVLRERKRKRQQSHFTG